MTRILAFLVCLVLVAGCSRGDDDPVVETPDDDAVLADPADLTPEAVRDFRCEADEDGRWLATGTLANDSDEDTTYQVVVFLGSGEGTGHLTQVGPIAAEASEDFELALVAPGDAQATCRIQVSTVAEK